MPRGQSTHVTASTMFIQLHVRIRYVAGELQNLRLHTEKKTIFRGEAFWSSIKYE